jgi:hypothetical protein
MSNISIFYDVLDDALRQDLFNESKYFLTSKEFIWKTNYSWHPYVVQNSQPVLTRILDQDRSSQILNCLFKKEILDPNENYHVMNYIWTQGSYIPWHTDDHVKEAMTIYINDFWNINWGGIFLWDENNEIKGHPPIPNTAIKNSGELFHHVTPVTPNAESFRHTIQIWKPI